MVDTVDGPTVAALHSEGGVQYRQMVLVTAGETQLGSSTPPDLFVANTTVADLLNPPDHASVGWQLLGDESVWRVMHVYMLQLHLHNLHICHVIYIFCIICNYHHLG